MNIFTPPVARNVMTYGMHSGERLGGDETEYVLEEEAMSDKTTLKLIQDTKY
jgi:hypothetical protein